MLTMIHRSLWFAAVQYYILHVKKKEKRKRLLSVNWYYDVSIAFRWIKNRIAELKFKVVTDTVPYYICYHNCCTGKKCANSRLRQIVMDSIWSSVSKDIGDARRDLFVGKRFIFTWSLLPNFITTKSIFLLFFFLFFSLYMFTFHYETTNSRHASK